jgi:hypothetical protein
MAMKPLRNLPNCVASKIASNGASSWHARHHRSEKQSVTRANDGSAVSNPAAGANIIDRPPCCNRRQKPIATTKTGVVNPNSLILAAICAICASEWSLELRA